jgi:hypothetical protein
MMENAPAQIHFLKNFGTKSPKPAAPYKFHPLPPEISPSKADQTAGTQ